MTSRGKSFSRTEDIILTMAWIKTTNDSGERGANQKLAEYQAKLCCHYEALCHEYLTERVNNGERAAVVNAAFPSRTPTSLHGRWKDNIAKQVMKMIDIIDAANLTSGLNNPDSAWIVYEKLFKERGNVIPISSLRECTEALRDEPKFWLYMDRCKRKEEAKKKREKIDEEEMSEGGPKRPVGTQKYKKLSERIKKIEKVMDENGFSKNRINQTGPYDEHNMTSRGKNFSGTEDIILTKAWIKTTNDSEKGSNQKKAEYQAMLCSHYKALCLEYLTERVNNGEPSTVVNAAFPSRTPSSLYARWKDNIAKQVMMMIDIIDAACVKSGLNNPDSDWIVYEKLFKERGNVIPISSLRECTEALRDEPKFWSYMDRCKKIEVARKKRKKIDEEEEMSEGGPKRPDAGGGIKKYKMLTETQKLIEKVMDENGFSSKKNRINQETGPYDDERRKFHRTMSASVTTLVELQTLQTFPCDPQIRQRIRRNQVLRLEEERIERELRLKRLRKELQKSETMEKEGPMGKKQQTNTDAESPSPSASAKKEEKDEEFIDV